MSNTKSGLLGLPVETLNEIGGYLERASDIMHLSHTCQFLRQVTVHPHAPCWRTFFDDHYDLPPGKAVSALRDRAIERDVLPYTVTYKCGTGEITRGRITPNEEIALKIIRDVIVGKYSMSRVTSVAQILHFHKSGLLSVYKMLTIRLL